MKEYEVIKEKNGTPTVVVINENRYVLDNRHPVTRDTTHILKILPKYFKVVVSGEKTFEIRKNDRGFKVGDLLELNEWGRFQPGENMTFTGNKIIKKVSYILDDERYLKPGFVCLGLQDV